MTSEVREEIRAFWNRNGNYDQIAAHGVHSEEEKNIWKNLFNEFFGTGRILKILDMGTGSGFLSLLLADMNHDVTGADWSETMLEKAKLKVKDTALPVTFVIEDAENLTFGDEIFDAVVSRHMLWTLANPQKAMSEWARVVKPGGLVIVDVPVEGTGKHHFNEETGSKMPFYNGATPEELTGMLEKAGFVQVKRHDFTSENGRQNIILKCDKP
jgi:ubiquinone/menaquinone biosynthesis C-methylase UbiE